jgi:UDP-N-acetyl-D-glucosamine/UDP-N-acetyl-D-galactosamine dehydrogenase
MVLSNLSNGIKNITMTKSSNQNLINLKSKLAIIGLGYVGLPLAVEFGKKRQVIGFDINQDRINELKNGQDRSLEVPSNEFKQSKNLNFTNSIDDIKNCKIFIVTIPTPVDDNNKPDLSLLEKCCEMIGSFIKKDDLIIFESTVYPGVTEEICAPIIEKKSGLIFNEDFYCGYSPERINPGDKNRHISTIIKVTSGSTPEISIIVDKLYKEIVKVGTHMAPSIKVAEAAKVIENTQRDVNIALVNELSIIFNKLNIDTKSVLDAAGTKWNFLPFKPGLVGGHCIGVDPYYLAYKSLEVGHNPKMIIAGRRINDKMASNVAEELKNLMIKKVINLINAKILIMGFTFKENCPDIRNTKIADLIKEISKYNSNIDVYDPWANKDDVKKYYKINLIEKPIEEKYDAIVLAVAHNNFKRLSVKQIKSFGKKNHIIYDLKYLMNIKDADKRL